MAEYPKREPFFAHRFVRALTKAAVAQDIGPTACWLLTVVAHQEDVKRYRGAVTFYNGQLMPLIGAGGNDALALAREKAVKAGLLHYEKGAKGVAGKYWILTPEWFADIPDTPCDESGSFLIQEGKPEANRKKAGRIPEETPYLSTLFPMPNPPPEESALSGVVIWWNSLAKEIGKPTVRTDPIAKELRKHWDRASKDAALREAFADLQRLGQVIRTSNFLRGQGWFKLNWLFQHHRASGEWNASRVLDGTYSDKKGRNHDRFTYDPNRDTTKF